MTKFSYLLLCCFIGIASLLKAQPPAANYHANSRFEQMGTAMPTPNTYRTASGAPGKEYWQNRVDYDIKAELDEEKRTLTGTEVMTYFNNSPDELRYLWVQLDQNVFEHQSAGNITRNNSINEKGMSSMTLRSALNPDYGYGYKITAVKDPKTGAALRYLINGTMMRIDLTTPIRTGQSASVQIDWNNKITDAKKAFGRSGYEEFKEGNCVYEMAQWFPRSCVYDDVNGWQHKAFLGQGEFTLPFGNYKVAITVPNDHILGATGELQNAAQVLTAEQIKRFDQARKTFDKPVLIVNQDEATKNESSKPSSKKTWIFKADNVRDFAFATSRKFIWDAMNVELNGKKVMAMSFYPKEANPLWGQYSTMLVAHTVRTYSKYTFDYPYPVAQSVHGPIGGMEYPMMSFNGARPDADGTYSEGTKNFLIQVVIHEVGHNWFPMIVNSDERQWSWMDEGLNSFMEYLTTKEWDRDLGGDVAEPQNITDYMRTDPSKQVPIMSSSDNIMGFGPNAYTKPATGLNILRETVMGRELFDYAFKEYANRWKFKHPTPADFFRTMEDASGVDLDWFWKGWFYGVEPVDQDLVEVEWFALDTQNPEINKTAAQKEAEAKRNTVARQRDKDYIKESVVDKNPDMKDFYNTYDPYKVTDADKKKYETYLASLTPDERKLVESGLNFYTLKVKTKAACPCL